ncbi:MerR family transcriptional regulator [Limisalsivibrio acetivorans]|uniref:MerR family transcriptional regulator n=1 Tax=Limisalsivibrio acetivorans TaxID=1304888 RepID=UPI0003B6A0EA|nr:MerR family transcriptional regulator [Limisalsivibrio acetivorans]
MADKLYYKIGEVCELTGLKPSVLRFWEKEFKQLRPVKSGGGQRFYTRKHIELLETLKVLLYEEKYTIEGVRRRLGGGYSLPDEEKKTSEKDYILQELHSILDILK